jgi:acetate kinase
VRPPPARNAAVAGTEAFISPTDATLKADVITAGEEHVIARETASCVARMKNAIRE